MLTFLDRLLPYLARLAKRVDLAAPIFVLIVMVVMILPLPAFILFFGRVCVFFIIERRKCISGSHSCRKCPNRVACLGILNIFTLISATFWPMLRMQTNLSA